MLPYFIFMYHVGPTEVSLTHIGKMIKIQTWGGS